MKKINLQINLLTALFTFLIVLNSVAQENKPPAKHTYSNAIGLRFGETSGATYKRKLNDRTYLDFIFGVFPRTYGFTALYEKTKRISKNGIKYFENKETKIK